MTDRPQQAPQTTGAPIRVIRFPDGREYRVFRCCFPPHDLLVDMSAEAVASALAPAPRQGGGRRLRYEAEKEQGLRAWETKHQRLREGFAMLKGAYR